MSFRTSADENRLKNTPKRRHRTSDLFINYFYSNIFLDAYAKILVTFATRFLFDNLRPELRENITFRKSWPTMIDCDYGIQSCRTVNDYFFLRAVRQIVASPAVLSIGQNKHNV